MDVSHPQVRGIRDRYLIKMAEEGTKSGGGGGQDSMDYGPRGRPTLLGKYDPVVRDVVRRLLLESGEEKVSTFLVIATAKQVLMQR